MGGVYQAMFWSQGVACVGNGSLGDERVGEQGRLRAWCLCSVSPLYTEGRSSELFSPLAPGTPCFLKFPSIFVDVPFKYSSHAPLLPAFAGAPSQREHSQLGLDVCSGV